MINENHRAFVLRMSHERLLEPQTGRTAGRCSCCGRDIYDWELAEGYAVFDKTLFCCGCKKDRHRNYKKNESGGE